jgi:hypothetical protein
MNTMLTQTEILEYRQLSQVVITPSLFTSPPFFTFSVSLNEIFESLCVFASGRTQASVGSLT